MRLLLFIFFLFPVCAMAQIEVVNEGMTCDSNSTVLEIGKFNYLRFKNLPEDAVVSVSDGIIKSDPKVKGRYYIPGQKTMEGRSTNLKVTSGGEVVFNKEYYFFNFYVKERSDTLYSILRVGNYKIPKGGSAKYCKDSIKLNPIISSFNDEIEIVSFDVRCINKRQDIVSYHIEGNNIEKVVKERFRKRGDDKLFIENIVLRTKSNVMLCGPIIILSHNENCNNR